MGRKSPQEKKRLSYARDWRNRYGENDKSSRKNIPRHKRRVNRENRHRDRQVLTDVLGQVDAEHAAAVEERLLNARPKRWRKWPGIPLGTLVQAQLKRISERKSADALER